MWQQWTASWGLGQAYSQLVGPKIRETVNGAVGNDSPTFRPPLTPGWLLRDFVQGAIGFTVGQGTFRGVMRRLGEPAPPNPLVLAAGNAGSIAGVTSAGAGAAMLATSVAMTTVNTLLDQVFARSMGRFVEEPVNRAFGITKKTDITDTRGNVPLSAVRQTLEQASRQYTRGLLEGLAYTTAWNGFGSAVAGAVALRLGGPVGAIVGALGGMALTSTLSHGVMWAVGEPAADAAQQCVRTVKRALGMKLDPEHASKEIRATLGDRIAGNVGSVAVPAGTAAVTGQLSTFRRALLPGAG